MSHTVIDAWAQHPNSAMLAEPMFAALRRWLGDGGLPEKIPLDATLAAMNNGGVGRALLSAWWGPKGALIHNDEVAAATTAHPEMFSGVASVDLSRPMDAVRELRRCVKELGFVGLRVLPWLWGLPPNDRRYYPLYAECVQLDVPFCLQVGHAGPLMASEPGRPIPYLDDVAIDFPDLRIVGGHIGYPWTEEMIAMATKYKNVYIDTSAYLPKRYPARLVEFLQTNGRRKVLFGSNYPMLQPAACLAEVEKLGLDDETTELFLHKNAETVFGVKA